MEGLTALVRKSVAMGDFKPLKYGEEEIVDILQFAVNFATTFLACKKRDILFLFLGIMVGANPRSRKLLLSSMDATQREEYVPLKLVVDEESNKVIFAEAGKDFVDVLCSFLTFPLGTITRLLQKDSNMGSVTIGCLNTLYQSVADLDKECMETEISKEMLLNPSYSLEDYSSSLKLNIDDTPPTKYYICSSIHVSLDVFDVCYDLTTSTKCGGCGSHLDPDVRLKKQFCNGFVDGGATFVITDDLRVMPNSMDITSFMMLQHFGIKKISLLKEMTVNVTKEKVLDMLSCALVSESTLTDSFLRKNPTLGRKSMNFLCSFDNTKDIQIALKLVIRKSDGKILYAQGDNDFADLLLSFLTIPLGGLECIFGGNCSLGSIDALYQSIVDLDEYKYFVSKEAKKRIVDPYLAPQFKTSKRILPVRPPCSVFYMHDKSFITCENTSFYDSSKNIEPVTLKGIVEGYVKGPRTYLATDDLVVTQASPTSALNLLNYYETPLDDLKEKDIKIGVYECLCILKASLTTTSALTNGLGHLVAEVKKKGK
ncbi:uncharacterized protein LOC131614085 [Vicia villosa]|uniref:uncharacterized protein LOC131614085 n=1 Tax=Vicia villosa TaxID=3911 RepID=UPI00273CF165|nr:uncharacterized protein LOC131614085 [Vicia villosa]